MPSLRQSLQSGPVYRAIYPPLLQLNAAAGSSGLRYVIGTEHAGDVRPTPCHQYGFLRVGDYTRLRFLGRVPLCGTGVTSVMERTLRPDDCSARMADSRPGPGPFTNTSTVCMPWSIARRAAPSALI